MKVIPETLSFFPILLNRPQSIAMANIHDLADKKVSLSCNVFGFFRFFFIAVKRNWHHQTFP
jgi:hypothetical protein